MANGDDFCIMVQVGQRVGERSERNKDRTAKFSEIILPLLPHIEEYQLIALVESCFEFLGGNGKAHHAPSLAGIICDE